MLNVRRGSVQRFLYRILERGRRYDDRFAVASSRVRIRFGAKPFHFAAQPFEIQVELATRPFPAILFRNLLVSVKV